MGKIVEAEGMAVIRAKVGPVEVHEAKVEDNGEVSMVKLEHDTCRYVCPSCGRESVILVVRKG